jgi:class 3 adenylate cyclase
MGERLDRQLAAVMFADMVGFTALMQEDEQLLGRARADVPHSGVAGLARAGTCRTS